MSSSVRRRIERRQRELGVGLWVSVVIVATLDVVVTWHGLSLGLVEGNPLVASLISDYGIGALPVLKAVMLGIAAVVWHRMPAPEQLVVPLALALLWAAAVGVNLAFIFAIDGGFA